MAASTASLVPSAATVSSFRRAPKRTTNKTVLVGSMGGYQGLKVQNSVASMGVPVSTDQAFADFVSVLRAPARGKRRGGASGGLGAQCNAVGEIFKIAAIMNGLTLVGVAVGFVLLRIEAFVEESEE